MEIKNIAVVGSGTMGLGIAQVSAMAGYNTVLFDISEDAVNKAKTTIEKNLAKAVEKGKLDADKLQPTLDRIKFTTIFAHLKAEFIIEAIVEKLEVKQKLFNDLASQNGEDCILATNTSSIPITQIAAGVPHPRRVVGVHFFNPAHIMKLVEIVSGADTDPAMAQLCKELVEKMGKTAIMAKDSPGFIVNRVARHFYVEGLKVLEENVTDLETIDSLVESFGFKMGPFRLMDLIGVDTNFSVTSSMYNLFYQDGKFRPSLIQQQKVYAGHHGRKTGKGFYKYE